MFEHALLLLVEEGRFDLKALLQTEARGAARHQAHLAFLGQRHSLERRVHAVEALRVVLKLAVHKNAAFAFRQLPSEELECLQ